jgi:hypothetical protein
MNQTSSFITGGAAFTAVSLSPLVSWLINGFINGFIAPLPDNVTNVIAALLLMIAHGVWNIVQAKSGTKPDAPQAPENSQGGFATGGFLLTLSFLSVLALSSCTTTQSTKQGYVQSCAAYNAAFSAALQLRIEGKLNKSEIDSISLLDSQITPICTGKLPTDPEAATQQITAAVTTLTILEAAKKASQK